MRRKIFPKSREGGLPFFLPALLVCCLLPGNSAWADAKQFIPKYEEFLADFGIQGLYERVRVSGDSNRTNQDFLLQEGFSTKGYGYIYSPLFVILETSVGLGLEQENINKNGNSYSYYDGTATQFNQRFKILPSHPYNLELYFLRATPMTAGNAGFSSSTIIYEHGARALYDQRPWSSTLTYTNREMTATSTSENENILYSLSYYLSDMSVNGSYGHTTSSRYDGRSDTARDQYNLGFTKSFEKIRFYSNWTLDEDDENESFPNEPKSNFQTRQEQLFSELQFDLPYNFDSTVSYNNSSMTSDFTGGERSSFTSTESDRYNFRLHHRLYKSLSSSFSAGYQTIDATGGTAQQENYRLGFDYSKKIPWGTVLAGVWNGLSYADNQGAPITLFEPHTIDAASANRQFTINYQAQTITRESIEVYLVDDIDPQNVRRILLTEGVHYILTEGLHYTVRIIDLPPDEEGNPRAIWDYANYRVDYTFVAADYELENKSWGSTLQLPLFDDLITPHYSYIQNDQKVLDGYYPGEPLHSKNHSLGIGFDREPFRGDATWSWLRSNFTDEDRFSTFAGYTRALSARTTGLLTLSFEDVQTAQFDPLGAEPTVTFSEQFYTAQAQVQTVLPEKNLNASVSGNYTLYKGVGESTILSFFSSLVWHVGKLDLNLSASYSTSESAIADSSTNRSYTLVQFLIKRKIL
ncbi:MAG: hypothetical protein V1706_16300 [Pseudomonadota bacterium]